MFAVSHDAATRSVKFEFGKPVVWLAMPPETALELARALVAHARACATLGTQ